MLIEVFEHRLGLPYARPQLSGALRAEPCRGSVRNQSRHPEQVVSRAAEDEQPVHLGQTAQLQLLKWSGLLQPSKALLH
jgi:hypothetical protein